MKLLLQVIACITVSLAIGVVLGECFGRDMDYNEARERAEREREPNQ